MMNLIIVLIAMMFVYVFSYPKYHAEQVMAAFSVWSMWVSCCPTFIRPG